MTLARRYVVSGLVQGVGFRYFTERAARAARVAGWVRNREDGSVEILAEGDTGAMAEFDAAVRRGPAHSHVTAVEVDERSPSGATTFVVRG
ncbi:MAG: acylphosphatase [Vicinamibacterales bacterium]